MLLALAFLAQVVATPIPTAADERPLRLWLGPSPVAPGAVVPVYVAAASAGYLLVLRVATDGRVHVVFPADPRADAHVGRGAYELRAPGNRPALLANEQRGTGLVLAALSATPFRFAEFSHAGRWDGGLLVASYPGADGPGTLTDIAQRMLGDGWFNYDFALYTVRTDPPGVSREPRAVAQGQSDATSPAPPAAAAAPAIGVCNGCTIVYQTASPTPILEQTVIERTIVEQVVIVTSLCEPFLGGCHRSRERRDAPRVKTEGICQIGIDCPAGVGGSAKTLSLGMSPIARPRAPVARPQPALPEATVPVPVPVPVPMAASRVGFVPAGARQVVMTVPVAPARTIALPRAAAARPAGRAGTSLRAAKLLPRRP